MKISKEVKAAAVGALITGSISIFIYFMGQAAEERRYEEALAENEKKFVETMAKYYTDIDEKMTYEEAIQTSYKESEKTKKEKSKLEKENEEYKKTIDEFPEVEFVSPTFINDGLKVQDSVEKALVTIDGKVFYSEQFLNANITETISYDPTQNTIYYNMEGNSSRAETKVDLYEANVLYDGLNYNLYSPSEGDTFSVGSKTYNKGFTIWDDHSLFGGGEGYVLFDLQNKYSKMTFDIGRTNGDYKGDAVLKLYLNEEYITEYELKSESPLRPIEIDLNYAKDMKFLLSSDSSVQYGVVNVVFYY